MFLASSNPGTTTTTTTKPVEQPVPSGHARGAPAAFVEEQRPRGRAQGRRGGRAAEAQRACAPEGEAGDEDGRGAVPRRRRRGRAAGRGRRDDDGGCALGPAASEDVVSAT
ncbi:hypothetical protein THAOC_09198 [Thalassiosira oceanica]|uniref:Uncharacterized protein n=1 Tax=Thalassiosira oceanica TaxID=159749 RepID=K0SX55_THAOC|nr:hypothetical protein THAOC_09198 [Thalassiosira oceanica]|eukprot:EJK69534.1 hypothetical protein THAOC_09198 [Thalassiosira oceanica]